MLPHPGPYLFRKVGRRLPGERRHQLGRGQCHGAGQRLEIRFRVGGGGQGDLYEVEVPRALPAS